MPVGIGIDDGAALSDFHLARLRQFPGQRARIRHEVAPVVRADGSRGIRRTGAAVATPVSGQSTDRRPEPLPDRTVTQRDPRIVGATACAVGDARQLGLQLMGHLTSEDDVRGIGHSLVRVYHPRDAASS